MYGYLTSTVQGLLHGYGSLPKHQINDTVVLSRMISQMGAVVWSAGHAWDKDIPASVCCAEGLHIKHLTMRSFCTDSFPLLGAPRFGLFSEGGEVIKLRIEAL